MLARTRTLSIARKLTALGPIRQSRRGGRLPRQQQPDGVRIEYFKAIRYVVDDAHRALSHVTPELVHGLEQLRRRRGHHDVVQGVPPSGPEAAQARALVDAAAKKFAGGLRPHALHSVAMQFGKVTSDFQRAQLDRQVRQAIGVPFSAIERPTRERIPLFASSNVELIKTVPDRYFDRVTKDVTRAYVGGTHPDTLAQQIADDYEIGLNDAMRISRDQIGKLNAQVNQDRQEALGLTGYVWRTMNDNRVRDEHEEREGESFDWDEPPDGGAPGEDVNCRCYAEPDFGPILDEE